MARSRSPIPDWNGDQPDPATSTAPWRVYNIGNNQPVELMRYIEVIEECLGKKAEKNLLPMQPGDVPDTYADVRPCPTTSATAPTPPSKTGIRRFIDWYRDYHQVES